MIHSLFGYEVEELNNDDPLLDKVIYCFDMLRDCGLDVYEYTGFTANDEKKPLIIGRYIVEVSMCQHENGDYDGVEGIKAVYKII